jgi:hypothetical protein
MKEILWKRLIENLVTHNRFALLALLVTATPSQHSQHSQ